MWQQFWAEEILELLDCDKSMKPQRVKRYSCVAVVTTNPFNEVPLPVSFYKGFLQFKYKNTSKKLTDIVATVHYTLLVVHLKDGF